MKKLASMPKEFQELRRKLAIHLISIGGNSPVCKRTTSLTGMAQTMGISKETVLTLLESLEQRSDITIDRQRILIKSKPEKTKFHSRD